MRTMTNPMAPLKNLHTKHWSRCFKITRRDSIILRLTDHDRTLDFKEGGATTWTYTPVDAPSLASQRWIETARANSTQMNGFILETGAIKEQEIREGRYDKAQVDIYVVDWRYPWLGYLRHDRYWMHDVEYNGEQWGVQLRSLLGQIDVMIGRIYNKRCDVDLFSAACKATATGDYAAKAGAVSKVDELASGSDNKRRRFEATGAFLTHPASGYSTEVLNKWYKTGALVWTGGNNVIGGLTEYEVQVFDRSAGLFQLWAPTPHDIVIGDTFTVQPGCDKSLYGNCGPKKFNNILNQRAFSYLPTRKKLMKTPTLRR